MDYDRGGQAPTASVASYRGSLASTATSNIQHICRRTQRTSSLQQPTRTPTTTEAGKLEHTYEFTKIVPEHIGSAKGGAKRRARHIQQAGATPEGCSEAGVQGRPTCGPPSTTAATPNQKHKRIRR